MNLNRAVEMDRKGIFPTPGESVNRYLERAEMILTGVVEVDPRSLEDRAGTRLQSLGSEAKRDAVSSISRRFGVDFSWVGVYTGYLGDLWLSEGSAGKCFGAREHYKNGKLTYVEPSFIVVNSSLLFGKLRTAIHELTHVPRSLAFDYEITYPRVWDYEEILARSHSAMQMLSPVGGIHLLLSPANFEYQVARFKLWSDFSKNAGYMMIRMTYDEVKDWVVDKRLKPKEAIRRSAEKGNLRFQIVREVLGF